jgi:hypothetical protein
MGRLLASPTNISLGRKILPGTNTLAYYENPQITDEKSFITLPPGVKVIKLFFFDAEDEAK